MKEKLMDIEKIANGFEFDGLIVYSLNPESDNSIFKANSIWDDNENLNHFVFFADNDISWYCYDTKKRMFCELDKPSGDLMNSFDKYHEMMESAFENILHIVQFKK